MADPVILADGTGSGVFQVQHIELISGTLYDVDTGLPEIVPMAIVDFVTTSGGAPGVSVSGGIKVMTPSINQFVLGENYDVTITRQVTP